MAAAEARSARLIKIDGSFGEGGGQILRSSLALSIITGKPVSIEKIRAGRKEPGLRPQHLTSVKAAAQISAGHVEGAEIGSRSLTFTPGQLTAGNYYFDVGTAGSTALILQTVLPPLMVADRPSTISIKGGTHNPMAPTIDFLRDTFLKVLEKIGPKVDLTLDSFGFYPKGGGKITARITPQSTLNRIELSQVLVIEKIRARAVVVNLPMHIGERELDTIAAVIPALARESSAVDVSSNSIGQGNFVTIQVESEQLTETITGLGKRGVRAEDVATFAAEEARQYMRSGAPVFHYLADQLILPMSLAGGGAFLTSAPSLHTTTNIEIVRKFLPVDIKLSELPGGLARIEISS